MRVRVLGSSLSAAAVRSSLHVAGVAVSDLGYGFTVEIVDTDNEHPTIDGVDCEFERKMVNRISDCANTPVLLLRPGGIRSDQHIRIGIPVRDDNSAIERGIMQAIVQTVVPPVIQPAAIPIPPHHSVVSQEPDQKEETPAPKIGWWKAFRRWLAALIYATCLYGQITSPWPIVGSYTVSNLPSAGVRNRVAVVTDAASAASCLSGGGSTIVFCRDTGSTWQPLGVSGTSGLVLGADNLTSVGAIPYVSAAGVLNQEPTALVWDAANDRATFGLSRVGTGIGGGAEFSDRNAFNTQNFGFAQIGTVSILNGSTVSLRVGNVDAAAVAPTTRNFLIGTTTDSNFKLDVAASGSAGTMRVYDATATTGTTRMVVRAGAGQSGNLQEWQAANGNAVSAISTVGLSLGTTASPALLVIASSSGQMLYADNNSVALNSPGNLGWTPTVNATSSKDLSLSRASAGVLQVGDGGSNANGEIQAKIHTWINGTEPTCNSTTRGKVVMVQGGAGVADTLRVCRKDAADAYAWAALY